MLQAELSTLQAIARPLVAAQISAIVAIISGGGFNNDAHIIQTSIAVSCVITAAALALYALYAMKWRNFSVMPSPVRDGQLCRTGPYRFIRHPMYTSVIVGCTGFCLLYQSTSKWFVLGALSAILVAKLITEEYLLQQRYSDYPGYKKKTWRLFPYLY